MRFMVIAGLLLLLVDPGWQYARRTRRREDTCGHPMWSLVEGPPPREVPWGCQEKCKSVRRTMPSGVEDQSRSRGGCARAGVARVQAMNLPVVWR